MSDLYDKIREDAAFRREWADKSGLGFEIPSKNFFEKLIGRNGRKLAEKNQMFISLQLFDAR